MDKYLPVFKTAKKDGLIGSTFFNALGVAVSVVTLTAINDGLKQLHWKAHWRYPVAFVSAFLTGAIAFLILWALFGLGMPEDYSLAKDFTKKKKEEPDQEHELEQEQEQELGQRQGDAVQSPLQ